MSDDMASSKRLRRSNPSSGSNGNDDSGDEDDGKFTKGTWCKDEDEKLLDAVKKFGTDNWKAVSQVVTGRSAKQCRDRYKLKLDPHINHGPWTKVEDDRLMQLAQEYGRAWTKIARHMPGRTENAVKSRISSLERSRTKDWGSEEDSLLVDLKRKNVDFEQMVEHFPNRSVHAIKKRWETLHMDELAKKLRHDLNSNGAGLAPTPSVSEAQVQAAVPQQQTMQPPSYQPQQPPLSSNFSLSSTSVMPTYTGSMSMMLPFNGGQLPMLQPGKFPPPFPTMSQPPNMHPGVANSRLARHSTSMTVLLQVLGESPSNVPGVRLNRENTSFTLPSDTIAGGSDAETPKQQLLHALGLGAFFNSEQKE